MPEHNAVGSEHIAFIANAEGFATWKTLWDANPDLSAKRKNPCILFKGPTLGGDGDVVKTDPPVLKEEDKPTAKNHKFEVPVTKLFLRLRILNEDFTPLKNAKYFLQLEGISPDWVKMDKTDGKGQIEVEIPVKAQKGKLTVTIPPPAKKKDGALAGDTGMSWDLQIGALNPIQEEAPDADCLSGVQQRLNNIKFICGPVTGLMNDQTGNAIKAFQHTFGVAESGTPDAATQSKLQEVHDKPDSAAKPK